MNDHNISAYLIGDNRHGFMPQGISERISKKISSLLLLLTCALTLAACGGGGGGSSGTSGGNKDIGLIRYCDFDTTARYTVNNVLPINEYSTAECNFQLPRNAVITATAPSNLTLSISVNGEESVFPADDSVTLTDGSDATATAIPLEGTGGVLITNINLTLNPDDNLFEEVLLNFTTSHRETNIVLGTLMYRIKVVEVPEQLTFTQDSYNLDSVPTPAIGGVTLITVNATNNVNPDNPNQINYAFAANTAAVTTTALAIVGTTGAIAPRQDITDVASYTFMVTASQQGAVDSNSSTVRINFLSQDASNALGLISQCSSTPDTSTPSGSYNVNRELPIDEDSSTECDFQLPRNEAIDNAFESNPDNLAVNITVGGMLSIFPADSITRTVNSVISDATINPIPSTDADGARITNINLTLDPADDAVGTATLIFTTYNNLTNQVLGTLSYPINVMPVDDAPRFSDAPYSFTTIATGLKGKVLGKVEATILTDNVNQAAPNYAFAADNDASADNFTIDATTGVIALNRSLVPEDAGNYVFNVIAEQTGTAGEGRAGVTIRILPIDGDEDRDGFANAYDAAPYIGTINVSGTGIPTDPYIISNIYQLQAIDGTDHTQTTLTDGGSATGGNWLYGSDRAAQLGSSYQLSNDIDASVTRNWNNGRGFNPIGDCGINRCNSANNHFAGVLNGTGFAVHNLFINREEDGVTKGAVGLFAVVSGANIMNFGLENANITVTITGDINNGFSDGGNLGVGGLIGEVQTTTDVNLNHVYATGSVQLHEGEDTFYLGGLIGLAQTPIDVYLNLNNSYTIVNLEVGGRKGGLVGGYVSLGTVSIINSYSFNRINDSNSNNNGGLVGEYFAIVPANIDSSYAVSNATGTEQISGLVGRIVGAVSIKSSYWDNQTGNQDIAGIGTPVTPMPLSKGLSTEQLQNCGLDGNMGVCVGLFPSGTDADPLWHDRTDDDGVTTRWDFTPAGEYPYLLAEDGEGRNLLPTVAEQRCQRNRFFYDRPCATE